MKNRIGTNDDGKYTQLRERWDLGAYSDDLSRGLVVSNILIGSYAYIVLSPAGAWRAGDSGILTTHFIFALLFALLRLLIGGNEVGDHNFGGRLP